MGLEVVGDLPWVLGGRRPSCAAPAGSSAVCPAALVPSVARPSIAQSPAGADWPTCHREDAMIGGERKGRES